MLLHVTSRCKCVISYPFKLRNTWKNNLLEPSPQRPFCESQSLGTCTWQRSIDQASWSPHLAFNPFWRCVSHDSLDGNRPCLFYLYLKTGPHLQYSTVTSMNVMGRGFTFQGRQTQLESLPKSSLLTTMPNAIEIHGETRHIISYNALPIVREPKPKSGKYPCRVYICIYMIWKWLDSKIKSQKWPQSNPQRTKSCNLRDQRSVRPSR